MKKRLVIITDRKLLKQSAAVPDGKKDHLMVPNTDCNEKLPEFFEKVLRLFCQKKIFKDCQIPFIVLREKDLTEKEYLKLFAEMKKVTEKYKIPLYTNTYIIEGIPSHLPWGVFLDLEKNRLLPENFGVSCHSKEDAVKAEDAGASYVFFSNVFETSCKKGVAGKGLEELAKVTAAVKIPVYALGGMNELNIDKAFASGAHGIAMRSRVQEVVKHLNIE